MKGCFPWSTPAVWPQGWTLLRSGGPCLSLASWAALRKLASVFSYEARRGVNGFGTFCRKKRPSFAGAKLGTTEHHVDTRVGELAINLFIPNFFDEGASDYV